MNAHLKTPAVKAAIDALQAGDVAGWKKMFDADATLLDDGHPRHFVTFSEEAVGHEKFVSIDTVSEDGLEIESEFYSDIWGRFRTFFGLRLRPEASSESFCGAAGDGRDAPLKYTSSAAHRADVRVHGADHGDQPDARPHRTCARLDRLQLAHRIDCLPHRSGRDSSLGPRRDLRDRPGDGTSARIAIKAVSILSVARLPGRDRLISPTAHEEN